jgi:TonB family protein
MTLWLWNLAAYSVQLAMLVGVAAVVTTILRINMPLATLRFWQLVFVSSVLWPLYQLWANVDASALTSAGVLDAVFSSGVLQAAASSSVAEMRAGIAAMDIGAARLIIAVLAAGAVIRLGWVVLGLIRLQSIRAASEPANAVSSLAVSLQQTLGVTADIRFSDAVGSPATIGARRPMVLLPRHVCDLPLPVQRAVLCHELIHVQRRDWLPALLEEVWCAVLWFHPAARALVSHLSLGRETLVDEATIAHTRDRRAYAAALLAFATARPRLVGATALIGRRHLERRIALIAQEVPMPRFSLTLRLATAAAAVGVAAILTASSVPLSATLQAQAEKIYKPGQDSGITLPRVVKEVKPAYTAAAMQAKIQGSVWMSVVVLTSGDIGDVTISKSLDKEHGLDEEAIKAVRQWKFAPGTRQGKPVPVEVTIEMTFTLKK